MSIQWIFTDHFQVVFFLHYMFRMFQLDLVKEVWPVTMATKESTTNWTSCRKTGKWEKPEPKHSFLNHFFLFFSFSSFYYLQLKDNNRSGSWPDGTSCQGQALQLLPDHNIELSPSIITTTASHYWSMCVSRGNFSPYDISMQW